MAPKKQTASKAKQKQQLNQKHKNAATEKPAKPAETNSEWGLHQNFENWMSEKAREREVELEKRAGKLMQNILSIYI